MATRYERCVLRATPSESAKIAAIVPQAMSTPYVASVSGHQGETARVAPAATATTNAIPRARP